MEQHAARHNSDNAQKHRQRGKYPGTRANFTRERLNQAGSIHFFHKFAVLRESESRGDCTRFFEKLLLDDEPDRDATPFVGRRGKSSKPYRKFVGYWRPVRESNPCRRREREATYCHSTELSGMDSTLPHLKDSRERLLDL